jgi:hypothetical protein
MDLSDITRERDRSRQTEITSLPVCTVSASYNLDLSVFAKHSALSSSGSHVQQKHMPVTLHIISPNHFAII